MSQTTNEDVARAFHEAYERLAPAHGYETRKASAKPWADVPADNKALMIATVGALFDNGVISPRTHITGMSFGDALDHLRYGRRVAREGWNGKGMWLILVPGSTIRVSADRPLGQAAPELVGYELSYRPHIDMKTVDGEVVPWIASQTDMLAEDWRLV